MSLIGKKVELIEHQGDGLYHIKGVILDKIMSDKYDSDDEVTRVVDCYVVDGWCYKIQGANSFDYSKEPEIHIVKSDRLIKVKK